MTTGRIINPTLHMTKFIAPKARTLNMEEKRKLEKLLLLDIDGYIAQFKAERSKQREPVEKSAVTNAPAEVKALLTLNLNAKKEVARTASELDRHGYSVGSYGAETDKLKVGYSPKPKPLADFDAQTAKSEAPSAS